MENQRTAKKLISYHAAPRIAIVLLIVLFVSAVCCATTTVVIATEHGIVVADDTLIIGLAEPEYRAKVFVVKERFAIASNGWQNLSIGHVSTGQIIDYEFGAWVHNIEGSLPNDVSFDGFVNAVNDEFSKMIKKLQIIVSGGGPIHPDNPTDIFDDHLEYVLAGYQGGLPQVCVLKLYIDWESKRVLGPYRITVEPDGPIVGHTRFHFTEIAQTIANFANRNSYAYKRALTISPHAFREFVAHRPITFDEAASLARALVRIEEETNPNSVGGEVRVVTILPTSGARYLVETLPKAKTRNSTENTRP
jgi:hypothetical protein